MSNKDKRKEVESILESISRVQAIIILETGNGNKRGADSARRVLAALELKLKNLKAS